VLAIKVLDFGISKMTPAGGPGVLSADKSMTKTTAIVGSPVYMSPEQMASSKGVDLRTDIWSLGVILYELVTGRIPFDADTVTELAIRIATEPAPRMDGVPPGLPPGFEQVVQRCLQKQRELRFQSVGELADALAPFGSPRARSSVERIHGMLGTAGGPPAPGTPAVFAPGSPVTTGNRSEAGWQTDSARRRGGKAAVVVAAAIALGVATAVAAVLVAVRMTHAPGPPAAVSAAAAPFAPAIATSVPAVSEPAPSAAPAIPVASSAPVVTSSSPVPAPAPMRVRPAAQPGVSAPPKAQCTPPYYFDAAGNRVFKKECF
jgi:serine/threonine-protein kinase